jgi:SulP family sulfate permease
VAIPSGGRWAPPYGPRALWLDVRGGLASSVVTLPLSLGLALASGLPVRYGLCSAIVGGFVASLATSQSEVAGPSAACVVIVAQVFTRLGPWGLGLFTAASGVWMLFLDVAGLAPALAWVPASVRTGLQNGVTLVAAATLAGSCLRSPEVRPGETALLLLSVLVVLAAARPLGRVGATAAALVLGTTAALGLRLPVATLASVGGVSGGLPSAHLPAFAGGEIRALALPALGVAVICAIESLDPPAANGSTKQRVFGQRPLMALGLANLACSLFGGVPASGGLMPGTAALRSNPGTPVAGIVHAVALAGAPFVFGTTIGCVPVPVLGGVVLAHILMAAPWRQTVEVVRGARAEAWAWLFSLGAFALMDLPAAVLLVVALSAFLLARSRQEAGRRAAALRPFRVH